MTQVSEIPGLVSVIMPAYNRATLIQRAIDSILRQTYKALEVIVVDDCSTDNTGEVVKSIDDDRVFYYRLDKNSGAPKARNTGIENARGEFIGFLDSDDEWLEDMLEVQLAKFRDCDDPELGVVASGQTKVWSDNGAVRRRSSVIPNIPDGVNNVYEQTLGLEWVPSTPTLLVRWKYLESIRFDESLGALQDLDLCIQLSSVCKFARVHKPLLLEHEHEGVRVRTSTLESVKWNALLRKYESVLASRPKIEARYQYRIGVGDLSEGSPDKARKRFARARSIDSTNKQYYFAWLLSFGGHGSFLLFHKMKSNISKSLSRAFGH